MAFFNFGVTKKQGLSITDLPFEILRKIFKHLPYEEILKMRGVDKRFKRVGDSIERKFIETPKLPIKLLAKELSFVDATNYQAVRVSELAHQTWKKRRKLAPNVLHIVNRFNTLSYWVVGSILSSLTPSGRAQIISWYIDLIEELLSLNNFCSALCIISSLSTSPIRRLELTWQEIGYFKKRKFGYQRQLLDVGSHLLLRQKMKKAEDAGADCIPYLGVFLKDLSFAHDTSNDAMSQEALNHTLCMLKQNSSYESSDIEYLRYFVLNIAHNQDSKTKWNMGTMHEKSKALEGDRKK